MRTLNLKKVVLFFISLTVVLFIVNCSSDDSSGNTTVTPQIIVTGTVSPFQAIDVLTSSPSKNIQVKGLNLSGDLNINGGDNYELSLDDSVFNNELIISKAVGNAGNTTVYVRFSPLETSVGNIAGNITISSAQATTINVPLNGVGISIAPIITTTGTINNFGDVEIQQNSTSQNIVVNGDNLDSDISIVATEAFEVSLDNVTYSDTIQILAATANDDTTVYVRFSPTVVSAATGTITLQSIGAPNVVVDVEGNGTAVVHNYITFNSERLAFGGGFNQSSTQMFNLHNDMSNIETVKMYVKLTCPTGGCDEWDVYANVKVKDVASGEMYELGRYITPYWNDNSQLERGFEFDVTDFKSLLTGATELRIRTECWNAKGYEVTVDFDYIEGTPDYPYYAVSRVIAYDDWSSSGVPYGVAHNFDLDKSIAIPVNAESTNLRTIISGWGHATPNDSDGRPCAEWCYRTHDVKINGANMFQHNLASLNCASNPVNNQAPGNWAANRAGWCPGMVVPYRIDDFGSSMAGSSFTFEYDYEDWVSDGANGSAYYATSTFVVVKSNTPINKPVVTE